MGIVGVQWTLNMNLVKSFYVFYYFMRSFALFYFLIYFPFSSFAEEKIQFNSCYNISVLFVIP